jgi:uncharacterized YigZ family protein
MFEDTYYTISAPSEGLFKDRGSRFIAHAYPVTTEKEIKEIQASLRKKYHDARHHCYAYRLGYDKSAYRVNDDGEPSGTAGKPIFGQIQSKDLTNIFIVVIRYFGGTLLGVSGLINAYRTAAVDAIDHAQIIQKTVMDLYEISFEYPAMNDVMKLMKDHGLQQINQQFDLNCKLSFAVRKNDAISVHDKLKKIESLQIKFIQTL